MPSPAVFLAFDSVSDVLLAEGVADGSLPTVRRLLERGQYFPIEDRQELYTAPSWPSLIRGCGPEEHLQTASRTLDPGTYTIVPTGADDAARPPFWSQLSDAGLRSTIVSVYGAPIVPGLRGSQVAGWGSNDSFNGNVGRARCEPPELIGELERLVGPRSSMFNDPPPSGISQSLDYLARRLDGVERQGQALAALLARRDYDFFFGAISECHHAGHLLWHYCDESHPEHDPDAPAELKEGVRSVYQAVDRAFGQALEHVDPEAGVFVVSPYTMTPNHMLSHCIDDVLQRGGWLRRRPGAAPTARMRMVVALTAVARRAAPIGVRRRLKGVIPFEQRTRLLAAALLADVDWSATRAFPLQGDCSSAIRVNLAGREPAGTVQPGSEYEALRAELAEALSELENADTGEPVVERVATAEEAFGGPARGPLPDLLVQWRRGHRVRAVRSPRIGEVEIDTYDANRATHRTPGMVIATGPGIPASGHHRLEGPPIRLADVGATALAWFGVDQPDWFSGAALPPLAQATTRA